MAVRVQDTPGRTSAENGVVILDGPDAVALSLTPEAATITSRRLAASASRARAQLKRAGQAPARTGAREGEPDE